MKKKGNKNSVFYECLNTQKTKILLFFVLNRFGLNNRAEPKHKGRLRRAIDKLINERGTLFLNQLNRFIFVIVTHMRKEVLNRYD